MELPNPVRNLIDNFMINQSKDLLINQSTAISCKNYRQKAFAPSFDTIEKCVEIENQLEKLRERLSSTKLSKGNMNDSDADFMNTLRVDLEGWKSGYSSLDKIKRLYADVSATFDEITVKYWQKFWDDVRSCEELVDKVWYAVVVSRVALLSIVYQYLLGYVLKGGTKAYSSGSLDFRDTFVSLLLFRASYVWIFFRDVAPRKVYRRSKKDEVGRVTYHGKYEPRFKPPREKLRGGTSIKLDHLPLGGYDSERDAKIVCQIAGFYYVKDEGRIQLRDGSFFTIPAVPSEQEQSLCGKERAQWVAARTKEVFRDFQLMNNAINWPSESNTVGIHDYFQDVTVTEEFSLDALWDAADVYPVDLEFFSSLCAVGEGLEGTVTPPSSSDLNFVESLIAVGEGSEGTAASPSDAEQVILRMERPQSLHLETNDVDSMTMQGSITQQLKEHLEAIDRRIAELHEQHLQREKQLEERISQLERNSKLQNLEDEYVRSFLC